MYGIIVPWHHIIPCEEEHHILTVVWRLTMKSFVNNSTRRRHMALERLHRGFRVVVLIVHCDGGILLCILDVCVRTRMLLFLHLILLVVFLFCTNSGCNSCGWGWMLVCEC